MELKELRKEDLNQKNNLVQLKDRRIKVSTKTMELLIEATVQTKYLRVDEINTKQLQDTLYIFRSDTLGRNNAIYMNTQLFQKRIRSIPMVLDTGYLKAKSIQYSGMVDYFVKYMKYYGTSFKDYKVQEMINILSKQFGKLTKANINIFKSFYNMYQEQYKDDIEDVRTIPEEINNDKLPKLKEGAKCKITVNAYERNSKARRECIEYYKKKDKGKVICQICRFDFGAFYGKELEGRIHVHHLKPLHEIGKEYEVDPKKDLIPICPNCHLVIHSKEDMYTPGEIKMKIKNNN